MLLFLLLRSAVRIIRVDEKPLCPELVQGLGAIWTAVPRIFVQMGWGGRYEHDFVLGESPPVDFKVLPLRAAGHVDVHAQTKGLRVDGLQQRLPNESFDVEMIMMVGLSG